MATGVYEHKRTPPPDITGHQFGKWVVLERGDRKRNSYYWLCRCGCGATKQVSNSHLVNGKSTCCVKCSGKNVSLKRRAQWKSSNGKYLYKSGMYRNGWCEVRQQQFDSQEGICPVCDKSLFPDPATWAWDHDHISDECRELLHRGCNVFVGRIENDTGADCGIS